MSAAASATAGVCLLATAALLLAERRGSRAGRAIAKVAASTAFVLFALQLGAAGTAYGRLLLLAFALSWAGDVLLLSGRDRPFLAGIAAFLLAHVAFAAAFVSRPLAPGRLALGAALMAVVSLVTLRWLWPHLSRFYRYAVAAYVAALAVMAALAIAASASPGGQLLAAGALAFAASDVAVARDRFVAPGLVNRAWGLPLYYAAQLLLAASLPAAGA